MRILSTLLMLAAIIFGFAGMSSLTQATLGVGVIGIALLLGVLARLMQAQANHKDLKQFIASQQSRLPQQEQQP